MKRLHLFLFMSLAAAVIGCEFESAPTLSSTEPVSSEMDTEFALCSPSVNDTNGRRSSICVNNRVVSCDSLESNEDTDYIVERDCTSDGLSCKQDDTDAFCINYSEPCPLDQFCVDNIVWKCRDGYANLPLQDCSETGEFCMQSWGDLLTRSIEANCSPPSESCNEATDTASCLPNSEDGAITVARNCWFGNWETLECVDGAECVLGEWGFDSAFRAKCVPSYPECAEETPTSCDGSGLVLTCNGVETRSACPMICDSFVDISGVGHAFCLIVD